MKVYTRNVEKLLNSGQFDQALEMINETINNDPESKAMARAYCIRAKILFAQNKPEFKADIKKAIKLNHEYKESYRFNAETRTKMLFSKEKLAEGDHDTILELCLGEEDDDDFEFNNKIGDMFNNKNEHEKALRYYTEAVEDLNYITQLYPHVHQYDCFSHQYT